MKVRREENRARLLAQMRNEKARQEVLDTVRREQQVKRSATSIQDLYRNKIARDTIARLREEHRRKVRMDALSDKVYGAYLIFEVLVLLASVVYGTVCA
jgi:hypothetical protein